MPTIKHAINVAELQLQKAIADQNIFKNLCLCFAYFYDDTLAQVQGDGYSDEFSEMVAEYFGELFNEHFKTDFIF
jgi:hypothetical protein